MKTYKQMAENVLKRRDEYDERKAERKAKRPVVSAAVAAAVMAVVILFGTVMGGVLKAPVSAPGADPPTDDNPVLINNETSETAETAETGETLPDETSEDVTETGREPDTATETQTDTNGYDYIGFIGLVPDSDVPLVIKRKNNPDIYGIECSNIIRYRVFYNTRSNEGGVHGNRVRILISHSDSLELISPDILTLDISNGGAVEFEVCLRYVDNKTNGGFTVYTVDDLNCNIDDNYNDVSELQIMKSADFNRLFRSSDFCMVRTKGYDFVSIGTCSSVYYNIAIYYGEVDEEGIPLYFSDPYMPDYYDCETCETIRKREETKNYYTTLPDNDTVFRKDKK